MSDTSTYICSIQFAQLSLLLNFCSALSDFSIKTDFNTFIPQLCIPLLMIELSGYSALPFKSLYTQKKITNQPTLPPQPVE